MGMSLLCCCCLISMSSCYADGTWGKWRLETKNGENGVHWVEAFKPIYLAGSATRKVYNVASGIVGRVNPFYHRKHHSDH